MSRSAAGLVFIFCAVTVGPLYGQSPLETALAATVTIEVVRTEGTSGGSGFIISSDGVIVTAAHVIENAISALVRLQSGEEFAVEGVLAVDRDKDYALIRIAGFDLPTVPLANSNDVAVGQEVLAIGAPLGLDATVSDGLVGAVRVRDGTRQIQITIPVSPGSSGGPVLTEAGEVIGLVVSGIRGGGAENLNFALPINYVRGQLALASAMIPRPFSRASAAPTSSAGVPITVGVATTSVNVVNFAFESPNIQVTGGATVTWTWTGSVGHNVTFANAAIPSSTTQTTGTHQAVIPNAAGTYTYQCTIHPAAMQGSVTVQ